MVCPSSPEESNTTTGIHRGNGRRNGRVAARGARAAAGNAGDRVPSERLVRCNGAHDGSLSPRTKRNWLCRGPERRDRISLCGWSIRSTPNAGRRPSSPPSSINRRLWPAGSAGGQGSNHDDTDRLYSAPTRSSLVWWPASTDRRQPDWGAFSDNRSGGQAARIAERAGARIRPIAVLINPTRRRTPKPQEKDVQAAAPSSAGKS